MKTTIVVEDSGRAALDSAAEAGATPSDSGAPPDAAIDAGPAPIDGGGQPGAASPANGATDGGPPPSWLLEAIAEAGGLEKAPSSKGDDVDAGFAPA